MAERSLTYYPYVYNKDFTFVLVGKNAHTTIEHTLSIELKWTWGEVLITNSTQYLGIIRHPIDRWIAGTAQFYVDHRPPITHDKIIKISVEGIIKEGWLDRHSSPQSYIYDQCRPLKLFRFEDLDKLWSYLKNKGYGTFNTDLHLNSHEQHSEKVMLYTYLKEKLDNNPQYVDKLLDIFKDDMTYYNNCYEKGVFS